MGRLRLEGQDWTREGLAGLGGEWLEAGVIVTNGMCFFREEGGVVEIREMTVRKGDTSLRLVSSARAHRISQGEGTH